MKMDLHLVLEINIYHKKLFKSFGTTKTFKANSIIFSEGQNQVAELVNLAVKRH